MQSKDPWARVKGNTKLNASSKRMKEHPSTTKCLLAFCSRLARGIVEQRITKKCSAREKGAGSTFLFRMVAEKPKRGQDDLTSADVFASFTFPHNLPPRQQLMTQSSDERCRGPEISDVYGQAENKIPRRVKPAFRSRLDVEKLR